MSEPHPIRKEPLLTAGWCGLLAAELNEHAGAKVRAVHQDDPDRFRIALEEDDGRADIWIELSGPSSHIRLIRPRKAPRQPSPLAAAMRKHLTHARLDQVLHVQGERVIGLVFTRADTRPHLWIELFGHQANWYLVADDGTLLLTPRGAVARRRGVRKGEPFEATAPKEDPHPRPELPAGTRASEAFLQRLKDRLRPAAQASGREQLLRRVAKALKQLDKETTKVRARAEEASRAETLRREAELLQASFHLLRPGLDRVTVPDYTVDPPSEHVIELDPKAPPGEQVKRRFERARKLDRTAEHARERLAEIDGERKALEGVRGELEQAEEGADLAPLIHQLPQHLRPALPGSKPRQSVGKAGSRREAWRTYTSKDGWPIQVGKSARESDELTMKKARPWHLFLHIRASQGSHVIVPTPRGKTVPKETLLDAAELCCLFSQRKDAEHNEVDYVERRYVRKPRGAAPGFVIYEREKTLRVQKDDARRDRLQRERPR